MINLIRNYIYKWRKRRWYNAVCRIVKSYGKDLKVNLPTSLNRNTVLGDNVNFNGLLVGGNGNISIGNNFHSGTQCMIITNTHNYDHGTAIPYDNCDIEKDVIIENNVWIGNRVIILGGSHLHEGCIIQAGSVVIGDIPYCSIAGGHPARVFKYRDIKHYERLKAEGKYM